jgi:hypothetical protein
MKEELMENNAEIYDYKKQIDLAYEMTKSVDDDYIEYVYRGNFSDKITENILNLTDAKFVNDEDVYNSRKRVSYLLIESLQNVIRHHDIADEKDIYNESLFVIQKTRDSIYITTANVIKNENIPALEQYLTKIRSLSPEDLKKEYHKILLNDVVSDKGGGGLGIVTMARRTDGRINFSFKKINGDHSYYYFQIRLILIDDFDPNPQSELISLKRISKFHSLLNRENILLNFNGSFAFENLESILPIIELHTIGGKDVKQRVFDLTVKMLRNIITYADEFEHDDSESKKNSRGVYLLSKKGGKLLLTAGNIILNNKSLILGNKINLINQTDFEGLIKIRDYLEEFFSINIENKPDLSLIDMRLKNRSKIIYEFKRINSKTSYFILHLVI